MDTERNEAVVEETAPAKETERTEGSAPAQQRSAQRPLRQRRKKV